MAKVQPINSVSARRNAAIHAISSGRVHSQEDLVPSAAISLATTVSYFTTAGAETATLADGVEGQIKTLICKGYVGNMVVTVASPGWGGAGTITFGAAGQACTLQYVQGDWYCIGNNAAVFA
jgi:hypothetical protein